jgi:hypothetical protein
MDTKGKQLHDELHLTIASQTGKNRQGKVNDRSRGCASDDRDGMRHTERGSPGDSARANHSRASYNRAGEG